MSLWPARFGHVFLYARIGNVGRYRRWGFEVVPGHVPRSHRTGIEGGQERYGRIVEGDYLCEQVLERREQGVRLWEQAVLFRNSRHTLRLEVELGKRDYLGKP